VIYDMIMNDVNTHEKLGVGTIKEFYPTLFQWSLAPAIRW